MKDSELQNWFHELQDKGEAPDFNAVIKIRPSHGFDLKAAIHATGVPHFRKVHSKEGDLYCSEDDYAAHRAKKHMHSIHTISVLDAELHIFRAGGGHSLSGYAVTENALIAMLVNHPHVQIKQWRIFNSGDGIPGGLERTGSSKEDLKHYLTL